MNIITVASAKGGVGKSTFCCGVGNVLALNGKRVLLVDMDIGVRSLDILLGVSEKTVYNWGDIINGNCDYRRAVIETSKELYLLPAPMGFNDEYTPEAFGEMIESLKKDFDFILIDCPAGIEQGFKNAIAAADKALIVVNPEFSSARDADRIIGLLEDNEIFDCYLVINKIRPDMVKCGEMMNVENIVGLLNINLIGIVPDDKEIIISANKKEAGVLSVKSLAGQAYQNIAQRLCGNIVPLLDLDSGAFKRKLKKIFSKKH